MKQITLLIFFAILIAACSPSTQDLVNSWQEALNKGDINAALSYLAEDAEVSIIPPAEGDGVYNGHSEIRSWYETIASGMGSGSLRECKFVSDTMTCISTYADEGLKAMGVDFIEGEWVATIRNGKIQAYTFTTTPDSLAKFPTPIPTPVESLANTINDLIGTWWYPKGGLKIEFNADGSFRVVSSSSNIGQIGSGTYTFDAGKVTFDAGCGGQPSTYEAYVTTENNEPVSLRMQLMGTDLCEDRVKVLAGIGKFYNP